MINSTRLGLLCWFLLTILSLPQHLSAQATNIEAKKLDFQHPELDKSFASYQVFEISPASLNALAQQNTRFEFLLQFSSTQSWSVQLDYHDIRAAHYREVAITEQGNKVLPRRPNITYRGTQGPTNEPSRFTITPDYFVGMVQQDGETYFLEPLQPMLASAPNNQYVLYNVSDVLVDPSLECSFTAGKKYALPEPDKPSGPEKMAECVEVDLATGGDILMFNRYGSVMAVNDFILNVTNLMEPLYDDFNLSYVIIDQFVVTDAGSNPWTTSDDAFTILDDFAAWAGPNFATHDLGQIWTANDIQGCGNGPGNFELIGCARAIGDVCGNQRYNVCEDFSNSSNCLRALSAHEIGHLFDGVHSEANNTTIMWGDIVCGATNWTANNANRIQNHINSRECLSECGECTIDLLVIVSRESCPGEDDGNITAIATFNAGLVTYTITGPVNDSNTTGLFGPLPPGNYTVRAQDDGGGLNCFKEVVVTIDDSPDTEPPTNVCPDFSQSYEFCQLDISPNLGVGNWFTLGADLSFTSKVMGLFPQVVNLSGCVMDSFTDLEDIELRLQNSYEEGLCPKTIVNEYIMRDECDNISTDRVIVRHVFSESVAPVWDFNCQLDLEFTTEDGNVCPADASISLTEGEEITVNDGWTVGGIVILPLNGCVEDECTQDDDLVIRVDDITITGDDCSRTITVTFLAIDECDNVSLPFVCNYTFIDNTAPIVNYQGLADGTTLTVECDLADPNWDPFIPTADLTIFDNCAAFGTLDIQMEDELVAEGICGVSDFKSIWRCTWTVTDPCDNVTEYTLFTRIVDTQGPEWTFFPPDVGIECDEDLPFQQATARDDCSEVDVFWSDTRIDGDCPYNYTIRRRWTAIDGCGNPTVDDQFIEVSDTTPPDIIFVDGYVNGYVNGQDVYTECTEYINIFKLRYATRAEDNCSSDLDVTFEFEDFGGFDCAEYGYSGHLRTTWTSTDECGNTGIAFLNWYLVDETAPLLQGIPEDICTSSLPPVPGTVQAVDECEFATLTFVQSDPVDCDGGQYVERTWTATDLCGNSTSATQRINLSMNGAPTVNVNYPGLAGLSSGSTVLLNAACTADGSLMVPDLVAAVEIGAGCSASSAQVDFQLLADGDCSSTGYLARYQLSVSVSDVCDNLTNYELFIEFVDLIGPEITGPETITVACGEAIPPVTATDACGEVASLAFVDSQPSGASCATNLQPFERVWTATDACGNSSQFIQTIVVLDTEGPIFSNVPDDACNSSPILVPVTAFDACSGMEVAVNFSENLSDQAGCGQVLTRSWTASDACGNTSVATQQVFLVDDSPPVLSFAHPLLLGLEDGDELILPIGLGLGNPSAPYDFGDNALAINDNCATTNFRINLAITDLREEDCLESGFLSRVRLTWRVADPCGNRSRISLIMMYEDTHGPDIFNVPEDIVIYCEDPVPPPAEVFVQDDYDQDVVTVFEETYVSTSMGVRIIRSWTASDDCGNTTVEEQYIDIIDNTLECAFEFPATIFCNSDNNLIGVVVSGGTPPYQYQWEMTDCDGYITSEPTSPNILYTVGYTTQNFSVTITDANGCQRVCNTSISCEKPAIDNFSGSTPASTALNVYPNPVDQQLQLKSTVLIDQRVTISIYNLYGQEMLRKSYPDWSAAGTTLDTQMLPNGTYIIRLEADGINPMIREIVVLH
jgi:hypothetical protein